MNKTTGSRSRAITALPVPGTQELLVIPLGGTDRVGMNATLVGYNKRWIMIDAGATFAGADNDQAAALGEAVGGDVQQIIPDLRVIRGLLGRLDAVIITHAHEDHIGALPAFYAYMKKAWPEFARVPLFATNYTRGVIRKKLEEIGERPKINLMRPRQHLRIGSMDIVPVSVTHSAPETCMLAIHTAAATIVFGSDAKLDPKPLLGRSSDTKALEIFGKTGVTALLLDSTNAVHDGRSVSESDVAQGIAGIMRRHPGRVVVSTFASNLARVAGIADAAKASGRNLGAAGRTILTNLDIATQCGLMAPGRVNLIENRFLNEQPVRYSAVVCTGTQAEQGSALRRAAEDLEMGRFSGRGFRLEAGDLVIHSARTIPGNEGAVGAMFDMLKAAGVQVMTPEDSREIIHASGHAKRDELLDFYRMLKPKFSVPVHGDRRLIDAHSDLARSTGVGDVLSPREGEILAINHDGLRVVGRIDVGQLAVVSVNGRNSGEMRLVAWDAAPIDLTFRSPEVRYRRQPQREPANVGAAVPSMA